MIDQISGNTQRARSHPILDVELVGQIVKRDSLCGEFSIFFDDAIDIHTQQYARSKRSRLAPYSTALPSLREPVPQLHGRFVFEHPTDNLNRMIQPGVT